MLKKKVILLLIFCVFFPSLSNPTEVRIISKVNNEIITNIDIEEQIKYLLLFNRNLKNLTKLELFSLSKNSLIKEIVKKKEIKKFINVQNNTKFVETLIKENYLNFGFKNKSEFITFLNEKNLKYEKIKNKLITEKLWNTLVYEKFKDKLKINEKNIRERITNYSKNQKKIYEVNLSEILFDETSYEEVKKFIDDYGFDSAAIRFSMSDTSSNGGKIGWISVSNLSAGVQEKILNLKIGDYSKPIKIPNGNLILKINEKREIDKKFDFDKELKKQILYEQNIQLNSFSLNYFKKLKQNTIVNEY